jgi:hypothetical protein
MSYTPFDAFADFVSETFPSLDRERNDLTSLYDKLVDHEPGSASWLRALMYGSEEEVRAVKEQLRLFVAPKLWWCS